MTIYPIDVLQHVPMIHVGRQTEAGVESIGFDCASWLAKWPEMVLSVWVTSPGADTSYEAQTHPEGTVIVWDVSGSDTITPGKGFVEVMGLMDGKRKLSARVPTMVTRSGLSATSDPPESQQPWFEKAMQAVNGVPEAINTALEEAKESGEFDGADGISPTVTVEDIEGGHRVTITDKDGDKTFEVMDGEGGGGASVQADWSVNDESDPAYVQNRTHWVERAYEPIVWDGSTEGRDSIDVSALFGSPAGSVYAYKVSDQVMSKEMLADSKVDAHGSDGQVEASFGDIVDVVEGNIWAVQYADEQGSADTELYTTVSGFIICTAIAGDFSSSLGTVIPSTGTYAMQNPDEEPHGININANVYHKIDKQFLPDFASEKYVDNAISEAITGAIGGSY